MINENHGELNKGNEFLYLVTRGLRLEARLEDARTRTGELFAHPWRKDRAITVTTQPLRWVYVRLPVDSIKTIPNGGQSIIAEENY